MQYGHFDQQKREYIIDRVDVPVSWTNYLGVEELCAVVNHTAGGYLFCGSPEHHRITRFRPNGVPMDRPGHYLYLRDDETGEYWSVSWQPCGGGSAGLPVPPRAELLGIRVRPRGHTGGPDAVYPQGGEDGAVGSDPGRRERAAPAPQRLLLRGVLLPPDPHRQPEFPDVPLLRREQL